MSEVQTIKEKMMQMAVADMELLFVIIGDLGFTGYKISLCKLKGYSLQQCALKYRISKQAAQRVWEKCEEKKYNEDLKRLFGL